MPQALETLYLILFWRWEIALFPIFPNIVLPKDFEKGYKNNIKKDETEHEFYK